MNFEGIYPPAITPVTEDEEVDVGGLKDFLDFLLDGGVHGIFLLGTNSEGPLLELKEKRKVTKTAVEHIDGRVPVIVGTACPGTREAIKMGKYAEEVGADAVHAVVPYYYPVSGEGLIKHYSKIAESIEIPLFIYHIPGLTGNELDIETLLELSEIPNIVGLKDSSKRLGWFNRAVSQVRGMRENFVFFAGSDAYIYPYLSLGAQGAVSAVANAFPELVVRMYEEYVRGNHEKVMYMQDKVLKVRRELKRGAYMSGVKAALKLRGMDFGGLRSPLSNMSGEEMEGLKEGLEKLDVL